MRFIGTGDSQFTADFCGFLGVFAICTGAAYRTRTCDRESPCLSVLSELVAGTHVTPAWYSWEDGSARPGPSRRT